MHRELPGNMTSTWSAWWLTWTTGHLTNSPFELTLFCQAHFFKRLGTHWRRANVTTESVYSNEKKNRTRYTEPWWNLYSGRKRRCGPTNTQFSLVHTDTLTWGTRIAGSHKNKIKRTLQSEIEYARSDGEFFFGRSKKLFSFFSLFSENKLNPHATYNSAK